MTKDQISKLSLIIPVFNASKTLDRCLQSVQKQKLKNFELILVDDGSSDDSLAICKKYASNDSRFIVVHQDNQGVSSARNLGLSASSGEYICFMDADDELAENYLSDLILGIGDNDLIIHGLIRINNQYQQYPCSNFDGTYNLEINAKTFFDKCNIVKNGGPVCKLFKKIYLDENNIQFDKQIRLAEDLDFFLRYLLCCRTVIVENKSNYYYHTTPGSATSRIYSYKDELFGTTALMKSWNNLIKKYNYPSLVSLAEKSFVMYLNRLIISIHHENLSLREKKSKYQSIDPNLINVYKNASFSHSKGLTIIKWLFCRRLYYLLELFLSLCMLKGCSKKI